MSEVVASKTTLQWRGGVQRDGRPRYDDIFEPFLTAPADRPFVVGQLGQSLDGRIATNTGESRWINGESTLDHLHRLRAHVDAVVVGIRTAIIDNPMLTVRRVQGRSPARVVLDPNGKLCGTARCLIDDGVPRIVLGPRRDGLPSGVQFIDSDGMFVQEPDKVREMCPRAIAAGLYELGYKRILIEGGAWTISRFIEAGAIDRLHVLVAPVILGSGKSSFDLTPIEKLDDALRPPATAYLLGDGEVIFDCNFRGMKRDRSQGN